MNTFIVYGDANVGKSTACYKLYCLLLQAGAMVVYSQPTTIENPAKTGKDFYVILRYLGKMVLITSDGDDKSIIEQNVDRAITVLPDYFIFAVRSRIWYRTSVARLKAATNTSEKYFTLIECKDNSEKDTKETQIASSIFYQIL